jgi:transcriptional regulator with XRE-family HTH domain
MDRLASFGHSDWMAKNPHYLRQWRKHKGLTLEQVAERLHTTHATLSRIERGKLPYNQPLLERLAEEYGTEPASLLMRDPASTKWSILDDLTPVERNQTVAFIEAIRKTGTHD